MSASLCRLCTAALAILVAAIMVSPTAGAEPKPSASNDKDAESGQTTETKEPRKIWLRLLKVDIASDSPLRDDAKFNHPPYVYVTFKPANGKSYSTDNCNGWAVAFPENLNKNHVLVKADKESEYTFEVWDSQNLRNKMLFSVGPFKGADLEGMLRTVDEKDKSKPRQLKLEDAEAKASITFGYAGERVWYRLKNITMPPESSFRKTLDQPPRLYMILKIEGTCLGSRSEIVEGWSVDFPNKLDNCWPIREGSNYRYSVELWNARGLDKLLLTVTGLKGKDFRSTIKESIDKLLGTDSATKIEFEQCESDPE
jgi:hypothetical protein